MYLIPALKTEAINNPTRPGNEENWLTMKYGKSYNYNFHYCSNKKSRNNNLRKKEIFIYADRTLFIFLIEYHFRHSELLWLLNEQRIA